MRFSVPVRWIALTVFVFSAVLNYLDRQVLATMAEVWTARHDFAFTPADYGHLVQYFSMAYAAAALFVGYFIDRVGLNRGATISVAIWSIASIGTGMSHSVHELLFWRIVLGAAEASGVTAVGKAVSLYLYPKEQAVGQAMGQLGLSLGAGLAPGFAVYFAYNHDWRWTFYAVAILGVIWIPVWLITSRYVPPTVGRVPATTKHSFGLLKDKKLWGLIAGNFLAMTVYSLWTNWPPRYLVRTFHLSPADTARYTWIVPICGYFGALLGGSFAWRLIQGGSTPVAAHKRACMVAAVLLLGTMAIPFLPSPALATAGMCLSFFLVAGWSTNHYTLPIDVYGPARSAFGVSSLILAYGLMQFVISSPVAWFTDRYGFAPVCFLFSLLPLASYGVVHWLIPNDARPEPVADDQTLHAAV
ncbi:MAG TPA: MFS transporter [Bryobacteraceae bacterium]|nr:MFS transporter [Bryobacteraceae bacterium]